MKKSITVLFAAIALMYVSCSNSSKTEQAKTEPSAQTFTLDTTKLKSGDVFYQCEMHPEVISDKPGNCPKCGMVLSERKKS